MSYRGDISPGDILDLKFTTRRFSTGAPFTLAGTPAVSVYKSNSTTESTSGVTLTTDFDARTGLNHVRIDSSSDGTFYAAGANCQVVITAGTVDSVSVVGEVVAEFSIAARSALRPTTAGRTLDVSAGGEAGIDWANIGSPTTAQNLSGTNIDVDQVVASVTGAVGSVTGLTVATVHADLDDIQARLPAALVSGRIDASVGAMAANVVTAAAIAADAITDAKVAADVTIASVTGSVGSVTGNVGGNVTGSVGSVAAGGIAATSFAAGAIDAAAIATDAIGANELAASAITEIQAGLSTLDAAGVRSAVGLASANLDTQLAAIAGFIDTEVASILAAVDTEIAAIKTVTDQLVAAHAEPTGVPAANETPIDKLAYLFMALRNRLDVTAAKKQFYNDGGSVEWEKDLSDDGTTYTETEANAP